MPVNGTVWKRVMGVALTGLVFGTCGLGCGRRAVSRPQPAVAVDAAKSAPTTPAATSAQAPVDNLPAWQRPFADATRKEPLPDWEPPATTMTGKSVGKLYDQVVKNWDNIHFVTDSGQRIVHHALLETDQGTLDIELRPDWAPNHVRNFVALAQAGYYDGLVIDHVVNQASRSSGDKVDFIEGGSPLGPDGQQDGIGYWLKDEFNPKISHEEGVVGASHEIEADSAACRFYVLLSKAPRLDGNYTLFGRVAQGLDVAHTIAKGPVQQVDDSSATAEEQDLIGGDYHLVKPVVIRKVTIQTKTLDKQGPGGDN